MASIIEGAVERIKIETVWLPPIVIDRPFAPTPAAQQTGVGKLMKPKITVTAYGSPVVMRPYGEPAQNWPILKTALIGLGGLLALKIVLDRLDRRASRSVSGFGLTPDEHRGAARMIGATEIPVLAKTALAAARRGNCDLAMREMRALERAMGKVAAHKASTGMRSDTETARDHVDSVAEAVIDLCAVIR
jgi:hypothetical protein